ncbi:MAG: PIN domain-containing protein, partial [Dongiaceae bacterium]
MSKAFFDTNVILYLLSSEQAKADRAEELLAGGGAVSVQVLNEFASVAAHKLGMKWGEIRECLESVRAACTVQPLSVAIHDAALVMAERYGLSFYDALIVAAAHSSGCTVLYS